MNEDKKLQGILIPFFCVSLLLKSILHAVLHVREKKRLQDQCESIQFAKISMIIFSLV